VSDAGGFRAGFEVEEYRREMLLRGLDEIGRTLLDEPRIAAFERQRAAS
jgi:3-isopropylmalate/(R)-2-methylmalate dehydratase small subunit